MDNYPTPGDNFIGAFADPLLTNVLHTTFNYSGFWGYSFTGSESIELIVNNGNSPDYVVDRLGPEPVNGNINNFYMDKKCS